MARVLQLPQRCELRRIPPYSKQAGHKSFFLLLPHCDSIAAVLGAMSQALLDRQLARARQFTSPQLNRHGTGSDDAGAPSPATPAPPTTAAVAPLLELEDDPKFQRKVEHFRRQQQHSKNVKDHVTKRQKEKLPEHFLQEQSHAAKEFKTFLVDRGNRHGKKKSAKKVVKTAAEKSKAGTGKKVTTKPTRKS
jgi:hypothetical protein